MLFGIGLFQRLDQIGFFVEIARPLGELRLGDTGRTVLAHQHAVAVFAHDVIDEDVLGDDDVALHAQHFGNVGDATRAVAQTRGLHDDVDRGHDHFADGAARKGVAAHGDHGF